jgi:hypothetical protein
MGAVRHFRHPANPHPCAKKQSLRLQAVPSLQSCVRYLLAEGKGVGGVSECVRRAAQAVRAAAVGAAPGGVQPVLKHVVGIGAVVSQGAGAILQGQKRERRRPGV